MARIHYVGANGASLPLSELEREKLKGQQIANDIAETRLRRIHEEVLEKREVKFVVETMSIVLRQELMRAPAQAITDLRGQNLTHDQLHAIKMSLDKTVRTALGNADDTLTKALNAREAYAELTGQREPSPKAVAAAKRKKERANAKRRVRRKAAA